MKTTLNLIRAHQPCTDGWRKLLAHLGKTDADDKPLSIREILTSNGLNDALWCLRAVEGCEKEMRLLAVAYARQVQHLMTDPRSIAALDVAEKHAHGQASDDELAAAWAAAGAAAGAGARAAAVAATVSVMMWPPAVAAGVFGGAAARAAGELQAKMLLEICDAAEGQK
jgi:hypothetical protein